MPSILVSNPRMNPPGLDGVKLIILFSGIQEISHYTFRPGIVCSSELIGERPKWEDWVMVESRRR